jgi:hypothetical protein
MNSLPILMKKEGKRREEHERVEFRFVITRDVALLFLEGVITWHSLRLGTSPAMLNAELSKSMS